MIISAWVRLPALAGTGVLALTACGLLSHSSPNGHSATPSSPGHASPSPSASAKPAWSVTLPHDYSDTEGHDQDAALVGDNLVVEGVTAVFGIDAHTGKQRWRHAYTSRTQTILGVAGNTVVLSSFDDDVMIDAKSGKRLWRYKKGINHTDVVTKDAVFTSDCKSWHTQCTVTRRTVRTGKVRWRRPGGPGPAEFGDSTVGGPEPSDEPPTGRYMPVSTNPDSHQWQVWTTATGLPTGAHAPSHGWGASIVGPNLIITNNDPPKGDDRCTVRVYATDAKSGRHRWTRTVFSAQKEDEEVRKYDKCEKFLPSIGAGTRIAASTADGKPQVFDMSTGRTVWRGKAKGVPVDGDGHSILVRAQAGAGKQLSMLDFATGRVRWTLPDPKGEDGTAVDGRLVTVDTETGGDHVLVYDAATGRFRARLDGLLVALGTGWVLVHSFDDGFYSFYRF